MERTKATTEQANEKSEPGRRARANGREGEQIALRFLEARGYRIVDTNIALRGEDVRGELDIVAWDGPTLCFVEVKTSFTVSPGDTPAGMVTPPKQRKLARLAAAYANQYGLYDDEETPLRFDVVAVVLHPSQNSAPRVHLLQGAFLAESG